jgi:hypothetical protein
MGLETAMTWEEHEDVYSGAVPVVLKHAEREDRQTTLTVAMTYTTGQPRNQKVLQRRASRKKSRL